ncbi:uncharacterized protein K452DRAFT_297688 [Aplosporella prunicola CBS 121167]|uniref:Rho-GAP domain-containing protein n=1 Tax=Aplosporella prunicola CBS 121167 TaxID=1176127 RepID=A0A6A6BDY6_9PEZI|nr:uncharacterized protein K452DRAFT_297688 [Aplosporella prunicola CBS 121167]KAF2142389.1 hypothetical protein K452DRAFT_297688 [Aplosporella prunicola CBS 121167]
MQSRDHNPAVYCTLTSAAMKVKGQGLRRRLTWNGKTMRAQLAQRATRMRSTSLSAVPPPRSSAEYDHELAKIAASVLYRTPIPSESELPIYILNAAALPDVEEADFDALLPYVLARLPGEEELLSGTEYEVIFFAGGDAERAAGVKKNRPGWGWFIQAYHVLSRAMRKRLQKLYIVHERSWVRILVEMFSTIVSPKFRRKIVHVSTLSQLALHLPIEDLLIPPSAYLHDRRLLSDIYAPYASGRRAFGVRQPLPMNAQGETRLPRVLRETTNFLLLDPNIKTEGLFRIPPHSRLKEILKEAYDRSQKFIIWKENGLTLPVPAYKSAQDMQAIIDEVDHKDAYGVYLAAGLIKTWYAELRQPIFPQTSYKELRAHFGNPEDLPTTEQLAELFSPTSEWSPIPVISREILVRHLLPLLSIISEHEEENRMSAENLAVCFAPTLLHGPDQIEDAKVSSIVRRILTEAVELWSEELRAACGVDASAFGRELRAPADPRDYEDPLETTRRPASSSSDWGIGSPSEEDAGFADSEKQFTGILLEDNENGRDAPPALPPRPSLSGPSQESPVSSAVSETPESALRRKPAPSVTIPPHYSSILADEAAGRPVATDSPLTYAATTDGFGPARRSGWSVDEKKEDKSRAKGSTTNVPHIIVPQRNTLTAEQIGEPKGAPSPESVAPTQQQQQQQQQTFSDRRPSQSSRIAGPPQLADLIGASIHRKPVHSGTSRPGSSDSNSRARESPIKMESPSLMSPMSIGFDNNSRRPSLSPQDAEFRKPDQPASSSRRPSLDSSGIASPGSEYTPAGNSRPRGPTIASLARPVLPTTTPSPNNIPPGAPPNRAATMAASEVAVPKVKTMSENLLKRMPSFEPPPIPKDDKGVSRLDLKKKSVDDLRRLYEDRTGTAKKLVRLGNEKQAGTL